ncbi:protein FAR1-RELATED SEQUENCE 4-like isoform X2 [Olea europaea var. sylvestris]|uniref:protein FAR1-RELATED SEQUENCE 4-like isoform X2 n=1 Tax=Olea europaea var. sylvestris TaxID=158386 RepID=UPI000C1D5977|nr:protein FAR1-RELATED SEQUENCE 4-like isoform X2 [Olea europaea var. sylvestris]
MESNAIVTVANPNLEPRDDMEFDTHEAAYEFYKEYAKSAGFGTAKLSSRRSRASKEFIDAKFSCIRYGNKQQSDDAINPRPSPKIGCKASMHVKRRPNEKWYVHSFVKEHNHELLPAQAHFFRSHRNADPDNSDAKVRKRKMFAAGSKQYGAYHFPVLSSENIVRNQHDRGRYLSLEDGGAQVVLEFLAHMQEENPKFFYALDFNEEHRLRNVFWVDDKGIEEYAYFGDVVSFDMTYFTNKFKIPLVLFIGVNHHIQPTLLGCAFIADQTVHTFVWLMQTWRLAMGKESPRIILTDQNDAIKAAVPVVFPDTHHFFHLWNVLEKIPTHHFFHLWNVLEKIPRHLDYQSPWHDTFMKKLRKCIYRSWTEELFEKRWRKLLQRFRLREDRWMQSLYEDRKLWVPTFMKGMSFAGLYVATRSESLNSFFDKYINRETSLKDLIGQYKLILEDMYEEEAKANFDAWHETPELKSPSPFEKQMFLVYTHEIFKKFQIEVLGAAACHLKKEKQDGSTVMYGVKDFEDNQDFIVEWNELESDIYCSCLSFEYKGYLCRHAIVVLQMSGVFSIPFKYILQRWTNAATSRLAISEKLDEVQSKVRRYNDLCQRAIILGEEGSLSQDSYGIAVAAIEEALLQCENVSNPSKNNLRLNISATLPIQGVVGVNQGSTITSGEQMPNDDVIRTNKGSKRIDSGKELVNNDGNANKKGKGPMETQIVNVGSQGVFQPMDVSGSLDYPTLYPRFLTTLLRGGDMSKRSVEMLDEMLEEQS